MQRPVSLGERKFHVLVTDLFTAEDRAKISAALGKFTSVPDLMAGANDAGLGCTRLDLHGRAWVVTYNGVEICLLFERQRQEIDAGIATTPSVKTADSNRNPWIRIDLLDLQEGSVHQVLDHPYAQLTQKYKSLEGLLTNVQRECDAKGFVLDAQDKRIKELEALLAKKHVPVPASKPINITPEPGPGHTVQLPPDLRPKPKPTPKATKKVAAKAKPKVKAKPKAKAKAKAKPAPPPKPKAKAKPKTQAFRAKVQAKPRPKAKVKRP